MFLETSMKPLILIGRTFTQKPSSDIAKFLSLRPDEWNFFSEGGPITANVGPDDPVPVPEVILPYALIPDDYEAEPNLDVSYVILVQGRDATRGKMRICDSRPDVAAAINSEVINGYSITFSAAVLKEDIRNHFHLIAFDRDGNVRMLWHEEDFESFEDGKLKTW
jgi:hypothetical protein